MFTTPNGSGISIQKELIEELEKLWFDFLSTANIRHNSFLSIDYEAEYMEGLSNQVTQTVYERNPHARKACIKKYGVSCVICKFNFEEIYGDFGKDFIHVHHLNHISKIGKPYTIDPINDLRPVCPNCQAMLHRKKEGVLIDELKSLIKKRSV